MSDEKIRSCHENRKKTDDFLSGLLCALLTPIVCIFKNDYHLRNHYNELRKKISIHFLVPSKESFESYRKQHRILSSIILCIIFIVYVGMFRNILVKEDEYRLRINKLNSVERSFYDLLLKNDVEGVRALLAPAGFSVRTDDDKIAKYYFKKATILNSHSFLSKNKEGSVLSSVIFKLDYGVKFTGTDKTAGCSVFITLETVSANGKCELKNIFCGFPLMISSPLKPNGKQSEAKSDF